MTTLLGDSIVFEFPIRRASDGNRFHPSLDPTIDIAIDPDGNDLGSSLVWDAANLLYTYTTDPTTLSGLYYVAIVVSDSGVDSPVYEASDDVILVDNSETVVGAIFDYPKVNVTTAGSAFKYILDTLASIKAMTDKFSLPGLIFAPFFGSSDAAVKTIWRWRDYLVTNGQQLDYQILGLASDDIVTWTINCAGRETTKAPVYVAADIPLARLELTKADTGEFVRGDWPYEIYVTNVLGDKAEKYYGTIRIKDVLKK